MNGTGRDSGFTTAELLELLDAYDDEARDILESKAALMLEVLAPTFREMPRRTAQLRDAIARGDLIDAAAFALLVGIVSGIGQVKPDQYHERRTAITLRAIRTARARKAQAARAPLREQLGPDKLRELAADMEKKTASGLSRTEAAKRLARKYGVSYKWIMQHVPK